MPQLPPFIGLFIALAVLAATIAYKLWCLNAANKPQTWPEYLLKLSRMTNKGQYEFFEIAADGLPKQYIENDWRTYVKTGKLPKYVIEFLEEGKEVIDSAQILI